ncbi:MAG: aa3-type cytochrome c oxidase subunit IV [Hyphomonadaceae bacterium]
MAGAAHADVERGQMDIHAQKETFHHFLMVCLWGTLLVIMSVALLTVAFAMNIGWLAGVGAYAVIGAAAGFLMRMSAGWWALVIGSTVLLGLGGLIALLF